MADLRALEQQALNAQQVGEFHNAAEIWLKIISQQADWEHGYAHYNLANCYFRLGKVDKAEIEYSMAIEVEPENTMFSDALESLREARARGDV